MDKMSHEELQRILSLDPVNLTSQERAFLRARSEYLTSEQKRIFKSVLNEKPTKDTPEVESEATEPTPEVVEEVETPEAPKDEVSTIGEAAEESEDEVDPYDPDA